MVVIALAKMPAVVPFLRGDLCAREGVMVHNEDATRASPIFYEISVQRLTEQAQRVDSLDAKAATVFAFSSSVLPVFGGLLAISEVTLPWYSVLLLILGLLAYASLLYFSYRAYQVNSNWSFRPDMPTFQTNCAQYGLGTMQWWVGDECLRSLAHNEPILRQKASNLFLAMALLPAEALLLAGAALLTLA
jgi:hypothetical protein